MWNPRVGGEKLARLYSSVPVPGSPPRGRGKEDQKAAGQRFDGITPAWAGKSSYLLPLSGMPWDHPRMGGEKITDETIGTVIQGSPPRGRGKVYTILRIQLIFGITPA